MKGHLPPGQPDDVFSVEPLQRGRPESQRITWASDPAPIADELLSSWLSRRAWANAMGPDAFLRSLRSSLGQTILDLDGALPPRFFAFLSRCTGMPIQRFRAMQRFAHPPDTVWARLFGAPHFCPQCWTEDEAPYIRWRWRATIFEVCTDHGLWLCNRCPACQAPLSIFRGPQRRPLWRCSGCQLDLRTATAMRASADAVRGQTLILDITDLAEEIGRPRLIEQASIVLDDDHVRQDGRRRSPRTGLALIGRSWRRAYSLLDGTPRGGVRTHLLRLLHGGSLEAALTIDPRPVRCWESTAKLNSVTLDNLIHMYCKPGETGRHVRPATIDDIPHVQTFCRSLFGDYFGDEGHGDHGAQIQTAVEALLSIRWQALIEAQVPLLIGLEGSSVVGFVIGGREKITGLLVKPRCKAAFVPVLLDGIAKVMLSYGFRRLEYMVSQADQRYFEEAGWRRSEAEAEPGQHCMEYSLPIAETP